MNRGSCDTLVDHLTADTASMRPRFMNRGSAAECCFVAAASCSFNEAPIHESGKSRTLRLLRLREIMLQ